MRNNFTVYDDVCNATHCVTVMIRGAEKWVLSFWHYSK